VILEKKPEQNELIQILSQELDFFNTVLQFSEKYVDEVVDLPVAALASMMSYRQEWIDKIQRLEERRKQIIQPNQDQDTAAYFKQISDTARKIVEVDEKIHQSLQDRKLKFIQKHADISSQSAASAKLTKEHLNRSKYVNIIQE